MIEQHYSHVIPKMFSNQLSGVYIPIEDKGIKDRFDVLEKTKVIFVKKAKEWVANYKPKGCIKYFQQSYLMLRVRLQLVNI
jgi:hypothetical protein